MRKTSGRLADGREIVYYDTDDAPPRTAADTRPLPPAPGGSEVRYDALVDEWVAVASHRQTRTFQPPTSQCPLCPSRPGAPSEIPEADYQVVAFENRFPSFATAGEPAAATPDPAGELFAASPGVGRCEVVCFTADHDASFASLAADRVRMVLDVWADRTAALAAHPEIAHVYPFENRGLAIGVTLAHPHGQIYGYPFVPPRIAAVVAAARRHHERTGGVLADDLLAAERADGRRVVAENAEWTAFVPHAARWPVEVHLYPRRRVPDLPALGETARAAFGPLYLDILRRLDRLFGFPLPYIAAWHQAPTRGDRDLFGLHLEVFSIQRAADKLKYLAGSESGMRVWINDVTPEHIAELLAKARG